MTDADEHHKYHTLRCQTVFFTAGLLTESNSLFAIAKEKHFTHIQIHMNSTTMNLGIFGMFCVKQKHEMIFLYSLV